MSQELLLKTITMDEEGALACLTSEPPASPHQEDGDGWSVLHHAALLDLPRLVSALLAGGAALNGATRADVHLMGTVAHAKGRTALHCAAAAGSAGAVAALLAGGADVGGRDADGNTAADAAWLAALSASAEVVEAIEPGRAARPEAERLAKLAADAERGAARLAALAAVPAHLAAPYVLRAVLSAEECARLRLELEGVDWSSERHQAHTTRDLPASAVEACAPPRAPGAEGGWARETLLRALRSVAGRHGYDPAGFAFRDLFFVRYDAAEGGQPGLGPHRDGSVLSFNVLLNDTSEFDGGGTLFHSDPEHCSLGHEAPQPAPGAPSECGDMLIHAGRQLHGAAEVTRGTRLVLVGFVDVVSTTLAMHRVDADAQCAAACVQWLSAQSPPVTTVVWDMDHTMSAMHCGDGLPMPCLDEYVGSASADFVALARALAADGGFKQAVATGSDPAEYELPGHSRSSHICGPDLAEALIRAHCPEALESFGLMVGFDCRLHELPMAAQEEAHLPSLNLEGKRHHMRLIRKSHSEEFASMVLIDDSDSSLRNEDGWRGVKVHCARVGFRFADLLGESFGWAPVSAADKYVADFERDGFVVVPGALGPEHVAHITGVLADMRSILEESPLRKNVDISDAGRSVPGLDVRGMVLQQDAAGSYPFLHLLDHSSAFPLAMRCLGNPAISLLTSHLIVSPPTKGERNIGWHTDGGSPRFVGSDGSRSFQQLKIGYSLVDLLEPGMGQLMVVPGSHKGRPAIGHRAADEPDPEGAVEVMVHAGDALIFQQGLWHAGGHNSSEQDRVAVYFGYGARYLRPMDFFPERLERGFLHRLNPVQRQLMGQTSSPLGYYIPQPGDLPLADLYEEHFGVAAHRQ